MFCKLMGGRLLGGAFGVVASGSSLLALNNAGCDSLSPAAQAIPPKHLPADLYQKVYTGGHRGRAFAVMSASEVRKACQEDGKLWITFEDGVFDVSKFCQAHPGGPEYLLNAVGGSIDAQWALYRVHARQTKLLESMRIGVLRKEDRIDYDEIENVYNDEPYRSPQLHILQRYPFDAEAPSEALAESFITPENLCYVRNHVGFPCSTGRNLTPVWVQFPVPRVDHDEASEYEVGVLCPPELCVTGGAAKSAVSMKELNTLQQCTLTATLMCTGNRGKEVFGSNKEANGCQISTCHWNGVYLHEILVQCGLNKDLTYQQMAGHHLTSSDNLLDLILPYHSPYSRSPSDHVWTGWLCNEHTSRSGHESCERGTACYYHEWQAAHTGPWVPRKGYCARCGGCTVGEVDLTVGGLQGGVSECLAKANVSHLA